MLSFKKISIKSKIVILIMFITFFSVLFVSFINIYFQVQEDKEKLLNEAMRNTSYISESSKVALDFKDDKRINEILEHNKLFPNLIVSVVYDSTGKVFSTKKYCADNEPIPLPLKAQRVFFKGQLLYVFDIVEYEGEINGYIYMKYDSKINEIIMKRIFFSGIIIIFSMFIALIMANILQRIISKPIKHLANKAVEISEKKDYSIRVHKQSNDEIGFLYDKINYMLEVIQYEEFELNKTQRELKVTNEQLEEMVYIASHDLKTPLISIENYVGQLIEDHQHQLDEEGVYCLNRLKVNAERINNLINSLLDISRLNTQKFSPQEINLNELVSKIIGDLVLRIEEANVSITFGILPNLTGDKIRIESVFRNLIINAINYSGKNIAISADRNIVSIKDDGIGIPSDQLERIFKAGERLKMVKNEGVGMGLTFCRKAIELHESHIWAESDGIGLGSTFYLRFNPQIINYETSTSTQP